MIRNWLTLFVQRHPLVLRSLLRFGQRFFPKALRSVVTTADAVREVFDRPQDFLMGHLNAPKLKTGPFLLGMDPGVSDPPGTSGYAKEKAILVEALESHVDDLPQLVTEESRRVIAEQLATAEPLRGPATSSAPAVMLELGHAYAERIYARVFARYFGLPLDDPKNPLESAHCGTPRGEYTLMRFIRTLGATIGSAHPAPFGLEERASKAGPEFRDYLTRVVQNHFNGSRKQPARTVIGHLCAQVHSFADGQDGIVRCVAGMLSAGASFSKMFATIVHELLRHGQMRAFKAAVEDGDELKMLAYIFEALRFRPPFPMLVRSCPASKVLHGAADQKNVALAADSLLIFVPLAAMFDPMRVPRPDDFVVGRPREVYMHFGGAPRECIGKPLIDRFYLPMFRVLFEHAPGLVSAKPGKFRFDSVALESYHIGPVAVAATVERESVISA